MGAAQGDAIRVTARAQGHEVVSIDFHSSDVALVHTEGSGEKKSYQTYVLLNSGGE